MATTTRIPNWFTNTLYYKDEPVYISDDPLISVQFHRKYYRAKVQHTSFSFATDWGNDLWEEITVKGIKGDTGEQGATGAIGPTGPQGNTGASGANGADGVFAEIASQLEAETGTNDTKGMTPLKTKQAFDKFFDAFETEFTGTTVPAFDARIDAVEARMTVLENATEIVNASGQQPLLNNESVGIGIVGGDTPNGFGNRWELNSTGAKSARIRAEIYRKDDAEIRFSIAHLEMHFKVNTWYLGRVSTTVLNGEEDGVSFAITTTDLGGGIFVGQVSYTSDNMVGGNYDSSSYIKFLLEEIRNF